MFYLFHLLLLLLLFFSTNTNSLNSTFEYNEKSSSNAHMPIETVFKLPRPIPAWPPGGSFASGAIDLGGLLVKQITNFTKIWRTYQRGPKDLGATFFEPSSIPEGYFMLGSYAQPNSDALFGSVLVAKEIIPGALSKPLKYVAVYSSETSRTERDGEGYIWLPIAPADYEPIGYLVTTSPEKPPLDKIRCVHVNFTDSCVNDNLIWEEHGTQIYGMKPSKIGPQDQMIPPGTFDVEHDDPTDFVTCLKNTKVDFSSMPNLDQVNALIKEYAPLMMYHPNEEFLPSTVSWFWNNGALLYKKGDESNPIKVEPNGTNLPMNAPDDGSYWLDLPKNEGEMIRVRKGNIKQAAGYFHIKPVFGGTYTDLVAWIFYPFNGNAKIQLLDFRISLGKIGEHIGDWEHVTLRVSNFNGELRSVFLSSHKYGNWFPVWKLTFNKDGNKPVAFVAKHSHAHENFPSDKVFGFFKTGLLEETGLSGIVLDTGAKYLIIAAEYLGPSVVEAPWLNYANEWGPKIDYKIKDQIRKIHDTLPRKLRNVFDKITNKLPPEVLGQEGPLGPKTKGNWNGDEEYGKSQGRETWSENEGYWNGDENDVRSTGRETWSEIEDYWNSDENPFLSSGKETWSGKEYR